MKVEYKIEYLTLAHPTLDASRSLDALNRFGEEGYELIHVSEDKMYAGDETRYLCVLARTVAE